MLDNTRAGSTQLHNNKFQRHAPQRLSGGPRSLVTHGARSERDDSSDVVWCAARQAGVPRVSCLVLSINFVHCGSARAARVVWSAIIVIVWLVVFVFVFVR